MKYAGGYDGISPREVIRAMRMFEDDSGRRWEASVRAEDGPDYKGRFHFVMVPEDVGESGAVALIDVRWNRESTATRTLRTMSALELRRRLRQGLGRHSASHASDPDGRGRIRADG